MNTDYKMSSFKIFQMTNFEIFLPHCDETGALCSVFELESTIRKFYSYSAE